MTITINVNMLFKFWWKLSPGWPLTMLLTLCKKHTTMACQWWLFALRLMLKSTACSWGAMDFWVQSNLPVVDAEGCLDEITWFPVKSVIKAIDVYNKAVPIFNVSVSSMFRCNWQDSLILNKKGLICSCYINCNLWLSSMS